MRIDFNTSIPISLASILLSLVATCGIYYYFSQIRGVLLVDQAVYGVYLGGALAMWLFGYFTQREFQVYNENENPKRRVLLLGPGSIIIAFYPYSILYWHRYIVSRITPDVWVLKDINAELIQHTETEVLPLWYDMGEMIAPYAFVVSAYTLSYFLFEIGRKSTAELFHDQQNS